MRLRFLKLAKPTAGILAIGFAYVIIHSLTGFALFCPVNKFLHLYCPGCGISRMFLHLLQFEFYEAFSSNCVVFCMLPVFAAAGVWHAYKYIRYGDRSLNRAENVIAWIAVGILVVFAIARNIWHYDILIP